VSHLRAIESQNGLPITGSVIKASVASSIQPSRIKDYSNITCFKCGKRGHPWHKCRSQPLDSWAGHWANPDKKDAATLVPGGKACIAAAPGDAVSKVSTWYLDGGQLITCAVLLRDYPITARSLHPGSLPQLMPIEAFGISRLCHSGGRATGDRGRGAATSLGTRYAKPRVDLRDHAHLWAPSPLPAGVVRHYFYTTPGMAPLLATTPTCHVWYGNILTLLLHHASPYVPTGYEPLQSNYGRR
jgi:hypothetical protein